MKGVQHGILPSAKHLPVNDVGVMFHFCDEDLIPLANKSFTEGKSNTVYCGRCTAGEDDLMGMFCTDEFLYRHSRLFICFGRLLAEIMHPPVNRAVVVPVKGIDALNYRQRFLCCRSVIKVYERFAVI